MSNTLFIGKVYHCFDELPSTNDWAAEFIALGQKGAAKTRPPEGTVVRAANQTAGKGQLGSRWQSKPGENLLLSIILYPTWLDAMAQFYLSMAAALALRDLAVEAIGRRMSLQPDESAPLSDVSSTVKIKWPNDLYLGDKKAAGILIQNVISGANLQSSIVGIGLNVNQTEFPADLPNATSLALNTGTNFNPDELAERLFECLEKRYLQLKSGQKAAIKDEYETHLWRRGISSQYIRHSDHTVFEGVIQGVNAQGNLLIQTAEGIATFEVKEVSAIV
ncbi:MAG: biotin--[acetyl-CoA-carboxylase] ligase [Saprospiraceae bacterium]|nr:biotin--[acetyl-CoA-carboxylase] ligase [Saprospiraceae bacterium]